MKRMHDLYPLLACLLVATPLAACSDDGATEGESAANETETAGDGDGDPAEGSEAEAEGDGDGDDPGDGDGDPTTGDGDGDPTTGDGDGDGDPDEDMDGVPASEDCDDADPNNFPGNSEICDGQDNDCNDEIDDDAVDAPLYFSDNDMDGFGVGEGTPSCQQPPDTASVGGDCNDNDPNAYPDQNDVCALGPTCKAIFDSGAGDVDGLYLIDPEGVDVGQAPLEVWCDMTNEGLTAALIINSVNEGTYIGDFGADYVSPELLAVDPTTTSAPDASAAQAWLDLNLFDYTELWVAAYSDGANTFTSELIARDDLRIAFGEDGYLLWNDPNGYSWCGGDAAYTDAGVGQVNQPQGAPADCKNHGSLGSGWDFSESGVQFNQGLTLCGGDASTWMYRNYGSGLLSYPNPGAAYVIWVR